MKLNKKQEVIIATVLGVVFLLLAGKFLISSLYADLTDLNRRIKLAEVQLKKGLRVQKNKEEISADYKEHKLYLATIGENERRILAELLKEVEKLVRYVGGEIINLTPQEIPESEEIFAEYKVNFRIEANYAQLLKLLSAVEKSNRLIKLEKLTVTSPGEGSYVLMVEGVISLAVAT